MALIDTLRDKLGKDFHPAILLGKVVADESKDLELRVNCAKSLMPYIEATHKSVEVRGEVDHNVGLLRVNLFDPQSLIDQEES